MKSTPLLIFLAGAGLACAAPDESAFERYKIIFQKHPFGEPPKVVETPQVVEPTVAPNWINDYRVSMLKPKRAGLVKKTDNKSILLDIGQKHQEEGIELVSIDVATQEVKLSKGGDIRSLSVNPEDFFKNRKPAKPTKTASKEKPTSKYKSFAERMAERRKAMQKQPPAPAVPPAPRLSGAELEKHLQKYQMEVIRKGLPPLPVKLTPDMEKQLIDEGTITPNP